MQKRHWNLAYVARIEYLYGAKQKDSISQCQCTKLQKSLLLFPTIPMSFHHAACMRSGHTA